MESEHLVSCCLAGAGGLKDSQWKCRCCVGAVGMFGPFSPPEKALSNEMLWPDSWKRWSMICSVRSILDLEGDPAEWGELGLYQVLPDGRLKSRGQRSICKTDLLPKGPVEQGGTSMAMSIILILWWATDIVPATGDFTLMPLSPLFKCWQTLLCCWPVEIAVSWPFLQWLWLLVPYYIFRNILV